MEDSERSDPWALVRVVPRPDIREPSVRLGPMGKLLRSRDVHAGPSVVGIGKWRAVRMPAHHPGAVLPVFDVVLCHTGFNPRSGGRFLPISWTNVVAILPHGEPMPPAAQR